MEIDRDKENRDQRRKHIQSAIDWLERADSSIAEEQDIKGDLNLMLAKAELQHEKENRKSSAVFSIAKEFLTRAGTFAVAGIIAAVIFYYPKTDKTFERVQSEIENSVAVDSAENEQPQPVEKPEKIIVEPVITQPKPEDTLAEKIKVEKIELTQIEEIKDIKEIEEFEEIDEYNPKPIRFSEERFEPVIIAPDTGTQVDSKQQIQDLVTSAGIVLRSK